MFTKEGKKYNTYLTVADTDINAVIIKGIALILTHFVTFQPDTEVFPNFLLDDAGALAGWGGKPTLDELIKSKTDLQTEEKKLEYLESLFFSYFEKILNQNRSLKGFTKEEKKFLRCFYNPKMDNKERSKSSSALNQKEALIDKKIGGIDLNQIQTTLEKYNGLSEAERKQAGSAIKTLLCVKGLLEEKENMVNSSISHLRFYERVQMIKDGITPLPIQTEERGQLLWAAKELQRRGLFIAPEILKF